jgi:hypothetical protein
MNCHGNGEKGGNKTKSSGSCRGGGGRAGRIILLAVLLAGGLLFVVGVANRTGAGWFGGFFGKSPAQLAREVGVVETADAVRIPLKSLQSGKALFLRADLDGSEIHYFVLKSSDGVYRAAYDTCDVCFRANRGYRQEGDLMVCNQCGQSFVSVNVNEIRGGCNPVPLERAVDGEHLVIAKRDLAAGAHYFPGRRA